MNINKFTQKSLQAVQDCEKYAYEYGNQQLEQEHLFYSLLEQEDGLLPRLLEKMDLSPVQVKDDVLTLIQKLPKVGGSGNSQVYVSNSLNQVLIGAEDEAKKMGDTYVSVEHLFLQMIEKATKTIKSVLDRYEISRDRFLIALKSVRGNINVNSDSPEDTYDALNKYGQDLVAKARE